ncbi:hypothetical protein [Streptomyces sp. NPDC020983]|uniref:hypothetical protein n=1 Tax=Streptomyces sp. NPDC020983 TaxID=3365106 RepID=UPI0037BD4F3D
MEIPLDRITARARQVRFWRTVLTALAGLLFGAGWVAAKACALVWLAVAWMATAAQMGWREARRGTDRPH